jgi:hypothetical protein
MAKSKYPLATGTVIRLPNVKALDLYMKTYGLKVQGWRGEILVLTRPPSAKAASPQIPPKDGGYSGGKKES